MNKFWLTIQTVFFCMFFAAGLGTISVSVLSQEIVDYYHNQMYLEKTQTQIEKIKATAQEFDTQIQLVRDNPEVLNRLREVQFGEIPKSDQETLYPRQNDQLDQDARIALAADSCQIVQPSQMPAWLTRINNRNQRLILFACGSILILISFGCFGGIFGSQQP